jgi:phospholipid/cholesterol/gamma-HCH transport system substrate-binding protein
MMAAKSNLELKVGIFTFIGLVILTLAIFSIGGVTIFRPGYLIKVRFSFASGIDVGAGVRVAGIEVGEVKDIKSGYNEDKGKAEITLLVWLNEDVKIPRDSSACVNVIGLIGESYLEIIPGQDYANLLKEADELVGRDPVSTDALMEVVHKVSVNLNNILNSINDVLDADTKAAIKEGIRNLYGFSESLDESLDTDTKVALKETIKNFRDFSNSLKVITGRLERGEGKLGAWLKPKKTSKKKTEDR